MPNFIFKKDAVCLKNQFCIQGKIFVLVMTWKNLEKAPVIKWT